MRDDADARRQAEILAGVLKTSLGHVGERSSSHHELPKLPEPPMPVVMDADAIAAAAAKAAAQVLQQHQQQQKHTGNGGDDPSESADGKADVEVKPTRATLLEDPDRLSTMQLRLLQAELQYKAPLQKGSLDDVSQAIQAKWNNNEGKHIPKLIDDSIKRLGGNKVTIPKAKADRIALLWRLFKAA